MTIFSVLVAIGSVLSLVRVNWGSPKAELQTSLNSAVCVLLSALIGGRIAYVIVNWEYFHGQILEVPQIWLGGLSWPGAMAGGILATFACAWLSGISLGILSDRMLPLLVCLSVAIWLGCWFIGCAYGPVTNWGIPIKDEWGLWQTRFPNQLVGAILTLVLFWGIESIQKRIGNLTPGLAASFGLGGLSLLLVGASLLRADPYPLYKGVRLETWTALFFLAIAILSSGFAVLAKRN